ncbi:MAG: thioesterase [Candidatus Cloacimonadales bacterium]
MELFRRDQYRVHSFDCDLQGKLTLPALTHFLQETAWSHSQDLQVGYKQLLQQNRAWVLYKQIIQMDHWPAWGETIQVKTWPSGADKLFCWREFEISLEGKVIGRISSSWLVINLQSRRPVRTKDFYDLSLDYPKKIWFPQQISKKMKLNSETFASKNIEAELLDLDVNKHVNNSCYPAYCLNLYTPQFLESHHLQQVEQQFIAEAKFADQLVVQRQKASEDCHQFVIQRAEKDIFKLILSWEKS